MKKELFSRICRIVARNSETDYFQSYIFRFENITEVWIKNNVKYISYREGADSDVNYLLSTLFKLKKTLFSIYLLIRTEKIKEILRKRDIFFELKSSKSN